MVFLACGELEFLACDDDISTMLSEALDAYFSESSNSIDVDYIDTAVVKSKKRKRASLVSDQEELEFQNEKRIAKDLEQMEHKALDREERRLKKLAVEEERRLKKEAAEEERRLKKLAVEEERRLKKLATEEERRLKKEAAEERRIAKEEKQLVVEAERRLKKLAVEEGRIAKEEKQMAVEAERRLKKKAIEEERRLKKEAAEEERRLKKEAAEEKARKKIEQETERRVLREIKEREKIKKALTRKKPIVDALPAKPIFFSNNCIVKQTTCHPDLNNSFIPIPNFTFSVAGNSLRVSTKRKNFQNVISFHTRVTMQQRFEVLFAICLKMYIYRKKLEETRDTSVGAIIPMKKVSVILPHKEWSFVGAEQTSPLIKVFKEMAIFSLENKRNFEDVID